MNKQNLKKTSKYNKIKNNNTNKERKNSKFSFFLLPILVLCVAFFLFYTDPSAYVFYFRSKNNNQNIEKNEMAAASDNSWKEAKTIYEFKANNIDGELVDLSKYKGRVVLIVK